ncbi:MAG: ABC transporter ATP-binding protein [Acutalibacteraceae bacterium]|nr:ABC transporter ATP-binding protein [Acutalibacteraceae bacterium]
MKTIIKTTELTKCFGTKTAVDHLNLDIYEGEIYGLLGVNGAGKTTTIRMLTGLSAVTEGEAVVMGHSVKTDLQEVKKITNISPQETAVAGHLTVKENLAFIGKIYGLTKEQTQKNIESVFQTLHLDEVQNQKAKTLSGGWQRRLSIAMALITDPKIIFLDEPTLGLDVLSRRELWKIISALKGKVTIILTTHYLDEVEALCDRIAIMAKGKLMALGTAAELKQKTGKDKLEDAFVDIVGGDNT